SRLPGQRQGAVADLRRVVRRQPGAHAEPVHRFGVIVTSEGASTAPSEPPPKQDCAGTAGARARNILAGEVDRGRSGSTAHDATWNGARRCLAHSEEGRW